MSAFRFCKDRQIRWARSRDLDLIGSAGNRRELAYTTSMDANLFEPLSPAARGELEQGDGDELAVKNGCPCKMQAVHSSAALSCNLFHYWRSQTNRKPLLDALGMFGDQCAAIEFEAKRPIMDNPDRNVFKVDPNLDVVLHLPAGGSLGEIAVECKFTELYRPSKPSDKGLKRPYLTSEHLWDGLANCQQLAHHLSPADNHFVHLHAAQLLKHILGLKHRNGVAGFALLYLWYDVPDSSEACRHRDELTEFSEIVRGDGVAFVAMTYQEVITRFAEHYAGHEQYFDYLVGRYLENELNRKVQA